MIPALGKFERGPLKSLARFDGIALVAESVFPPPLPPLPSFHFSSPLLCPPLHAVLERHPNSFGDNKAPLTFCASMNRSEPPGCGETEQHKSKNEKKKNTKRGKELKNVFGNKKFIFTSGPCLVFLFSPEAVRNEVSSLLANVSECGLLTEQPISLLHLPSAKCSSVALLVCSPPDQAHNRKAVPLTHQKKNPTLWPSTHYGPRMITAPWMD